MMTRRMLWLFVYLALPATAVGQKYKIDTRIGGNPTRPNTGGEFGIFNGYKYETGQSFTVREGFSVLETFSFFLTGQDYPNYQPIFPFRAFISTWDGVLNRPGSDVIFTSALMHTRKESDYVEHVIDARSLALQPGVIYFAFLRPEGDFGLQWSAGIQSVYSGAYTEGGLFMTRYYYTGKVETSDAIDHANGDLAFTAEFSQTPTVTPEPFTVMLLGSGLAGLGAVRRRRRRE